MHRALVLATLLLSTSVLAGCTVPSGVNEDAYGHYPPVADGPRQIPLGDADVFMDAMRKLARDREPLEDEWAYAAFLENATRWGHEGFTAWDANWSLDVSRPEAHVALGSLDDLDAAGKGAFKELSARSPVRTLHALRHGVFDADADAAAVAERLLDRARVELSQANASVHAMRGNVSLPARDAFLRAEAVLGLAFTQLEAAERTGVAGPQARSTAVSALEVRFSAASVRWWLDLAAHENAAHPEAPRVAWRADLTDLTHTMIANAEEAARLGEDAPSHAHGMVGELRAGLQLVRALLAAGLPEGAWAAAQGLQENVLLVTMFANGEIPSVPDVETAWTDAAANVRTFRDAQRFDVALSLVDPAYADERFGGSRDPVDHARAFAALSLMAAISRTRESVLGPDTEAGAGDG